MNKQHQQTHQRHPKRQPAKSISFISIVFIFIFLLMCSKLRETSKGSQSTQNPTNEANTDIPTYEGNTAGLTKVASTDIHTKVASTDILTKEASTDIPTNEGNTDSPTEEEIMDSFTEEDDTDIPTNDTTQTPSEDTKDSKHDSRPPVSKPGVEGHPTAPEIPRLVFRHVPKNIRRIVCVYDKHLPQSNDTEEFTAMNLDASLCTDLYYHFENVSDVIKVINERRLPKFIDINDHKVKHTHLRTFLTVAAFDQMPEIFETRMSLKTTSESLAYYLRLWGFDGLNVVWPDPNRLMFTALLYSLRIAFGEEEHLVKKHARLLLAAMVSGDVDKITQLYEVKPVSVLLDQINILAFDFPSEKGQVTLLKSPLFDSNYVESPTEASPSVNASRSCINLNGTDEQCSGINADNNNIKNKKTNPTSKTMASTSKNATIEDSGSNNGFKDGSPDTRYTAAAFRDTTGTVAFGEHNVDKTLKFWGSHGADVSKINLVIPLSGTGYLLETARRAIGSPVKGLAPPNLAEEPGRILGIEICNMTAKLGKVYRASQYVKAPFIVIGDKWITYDDIKSVEQKIEYLKNVGIGGVMIMSMNEDASKVDGQCLLRDFPIHRMVYKTSAVNSPDLLALPDYCSGRRNTLDETHAVNALGLNIIKYLEGST